MLFYVRMSARNVSFDPNFDRTLLGFDLGWKNREEVRTKGIDTMTVFPFLDLRKRDIFWPKPRLLQESVIP